MKSQLAPVPASSPFSANIPLDNFFAASEARQDRWHQLTRQSQALATGGPGDGVKEQVASLLTEITVFEEYFAYPGPELMKSLNALFGANDFNSFSQVVRKINNALVTHSFRHDPNAWNIHQPADIAISEVLPPSQTLAGTKLRPYFELLIVTAAERSTWGKIRDSLRALARAEDDFVYEPVFVNSYEDALLATILNYNIQAVVMYDGFTFASTYQLPLLKKLLDRHVDKKAQKNRALDLGTTLAAAVKAIRPELDIYLLTGGDVETLAGSEEVAPIRRVFYAIEELLEMHLSILDGVAERYRTPYFDNLKKYAQRPIGTFHALPIARGKSIFKSNWIRDMGEFYGTNLFLAESSATTGGLDSLLEPTGNIKLAQEAAARAFGADLTFFATNGTSTSNKIVSQAILAPGDIVLIDRDCHKSHHYAAVLAGAQPYYIDAFQLPEYSMYGSVPIRRIKEALLKLKAEGKLDRAKMLILTNCTFDGHLANVRRTMEECLAIKPDLVFLWDEAWSGFARFSPFLRRRTGMDGAAWLRSLKKDPSYRTKYKEFSSDIGEIDIKNPKVLEKRLMPDPEKMKVRVYQTNSIHKSMSALRQASIMLVADDEFNKVEESFHEAFFTHTSTSPNLQIIASIDVARRQMELEGYELVSRAIQLSLELRNEINTHPLISKYFKALTSAEMIPAEFRKSGITDYNAPDTDWLKALDSLDEDEFCLDPTRVTLLCGNAGFDGTQFKGLLASDYDIQLNKTSRNSVLLQININNTRSDLAQIIKVLAEISRNVDDKLAKGSDEDREAFAARVKSLIHDVPDLPDFSTFHNAFRDNAKSKTAEGHMREGFYMAYNADNCEHVKLMSKEIEDRLDKGPELVSANFVIPYPPGFPIMVPGQVITREIITFMRKLDVKEIHGYQAGQGLKLIKPSVLDAHKQPKKG